MTPVILALLLATAASAGTTDTLVTGTSIGYSAEYAVSGGKAVWSSVGQTDTMTNWLAPGDSLYSLGGAYYTPNPNWPAIGYNWLVPTPPAAPDRWVTEDTLAMPTGRALIGAHPGRAHTWVYGDTTYVDDGTQRIAICQTCLLAVVQRRVAPPEPRNAVFDSLRALLELEDRP